MKQIRKYSDERLDSFCVYCAKLPDTRDHVPSKVLLTQPYPENLPVVPCCEKCNNGFSQDEEYFACLIECVLFGTVEIENLQRDAIKSILRRKPALHKKIAQVLLPTQTNPVFQPDWERVNNVFIKLSKGHAAFENSELQLDDPTSLIVKPLMSMTEEESKIFWAENTSFALPEIGSRLFQRLMLGGDSWVHVQPGSYQYSVDFMLAVHIRVRIIVRDYLTCTALW
jgi:hypothetical protein